MYANHSSLVFLVLPAHKAPPSFLLHTGLVLLHQVVVAPLTVTQSGQRPDGLAEMTCTSQR